MKGQTKLIHVLDVFIVVAKGDKVGDVDWKGAGGEESLWVMEVFFILIWVKITQGFFCLALCQNTSVCIPT